MQINQEILTCFQSMLFLLAPILGLGCIPSNSTFHPTVNVAGNVQLDGKPLPEAKIVFVPEKLMATARKIIPLAYGTTDPEGNFELKLSDESTAIAVGEYRVIISKPGNVSSDRQPRIVFDEQPASGIAGEMKHDEFEQLRQQISRRELLPAHYNESTTLTFTVGSSQPEIKANFDLSMIDPLLID